jgi:hypothetical protein
MFPDAYKAARLFAHLFSDLPQTTKTTKYIRSYLRGTDIVGHARTLNFSN